MLILKSKEYLCSNFYERVGKEDKHYYQMEVKDSDNISYLLFINKETINTNLMGKKIILTYVVDNRGNITLNTIEEKK